jgi:predicted metal-dependent HD superfamily phosphohydrolase
MDYKELLQKVKEQVTVFYSDHADADLFYHSQSLTKEVLATAKRMADHYRLDEHAYFIVCAAASFLYSGFHQADKKNCEAKSAELAETFLQLKGVDPGTITEIKNCILATASQNPVTLPEKIICDASTYHFGTNSFQDKMQLLRKEKEATGTGKTDGAGWRTTIINMLQTHRYYTDFCQLLLNQTKAENLAALQNRHEEKIIKAKASAEKKALAKEEAAQKPKEQEQEDAIPEKIKPVRGIETIFRMNSTNNIRMSIMADRKAHIMISVNSIIISVTLGLVIKNLNDNRHLLIPALIILTVSVISIIYAILATRPKMMDGKFTHEQVEKKSVNLFFFGSFYNMRLAEYEEGIRTMITDKQFIQNSLTKDIYWQGKVLGRKYRLLNISYTVFMYGLIISVLAFTLATVLYN